MKKSKVVIHKIFTLPKLDKNVEFFVEAKPGKRWVTVGGPFPDRESAVRFAQKYSRDHTDVEVRVVALQG